MRPAICRSNAHDPCRDAISAPRRIVSGQIASCGIDPDPCRNAGFRGGSRWKLPAWDVAEADGSVWDGAYVGASIGYTMMKGTAAGQSDNDVRDNLRGTATLADLNPDRVVDGIDGRDEELSYGGAIGYNWSSQGVVFGVEGAYQRTDLSISGDETTRHFYQDAGDVNGQTVFRNFQGRYGGEINITDIAAVKGRLGYDMGSFLPFMTLGVAAVRGSTSHYTAIGAGDTFGTPAVNVPNRPQYSVSTSNEFGYGFVGVRALISCSAPASSSAANGRSCASAPSTASRWTCRPSSRCWQQNSETHATIVFPTFSRLTPTRFCPSHRVGHPIPMWGVHL